MLNKLKIVERLILLPSEMKEIELEIFTLTNQLNTLQKEYEGLELKEMGYINSVLTPDGKKVYPNAESRQAALQERLIENVNYHKKVVESDTIKHNLELGKIDFNEKRREFSMMKTLAEMNMEE